VGSSKSHKGPDCRLARLEQAREAAGDQPFDVDAAVSLRKAKQVVLAELGHSQVQNRSLNEKPRPEWRSERGKQG
jgi:hypothetical protein